MKRIATPLWKRALAVTLAGALAVTMCPASALAADEAVSGDTTTTEPTDPTTPEPTTPEPTTPTTPEPPAPVTPEPAAPVNPAPATPAAPTATPAKPAKPAKAVVAFKTASKLAGAKWKKVKLGQVAGKESTTKYMTALRIYNQSKNIKGSIQYSVYMTGKGWSGWKKDGKTAGTGRAKNVLQGLRVKLSDELAKQYNVYYRVNLMGVGWTGWGKNGQKVGAPKVSKVKAYQVKLVKKSNKKANKKYSSKAYRKNMLYKGSSRFEMGNQMAMAQKAQGQTSNTKWLILVDTHKNRVEILKGEKGAWQVHKYYKCTTGAPGSGTVRGKFTIQDRGYVFGSGFSCWYWTQFYGNYLFHSILYNPGSMSSVQDGRLGINASHGCVRLSLGDAKWINKNIPRGTKVWSY